MIVTYTDFSHRGPYTGQMLAVLKQRVPAVPVVDLMDDVPAFDIRAGAYLLPPVMTPFAPGTVCVGVVDPGVGGSRDPLVLKAAGRWYVGPDNGLFEIAARRAEGDARWWRITWRPERLSASFHGRDLFAPVAAMIAAGDDGDAPGWGAAFEPDRSAYRDWPDDWPAVIYIDGYGNCMTGVRWSQLHDGEGLRIGDVTIPRARTFSEVSPGAAFCYENALGLAEIAVNKGSAARVLSLRTGIQVAVSKL